MNALTRMAIWAGGAALLGATTIDTLAVIGRNAGVPLTGSIELMQVVIITSGAIGLVLATLEGVHARVRLVLDRLPPRAAHLFERLDNLLTLLFVSALLAGSLWLAADLWHGHEESEVLGVPWAMLRAIANVALFVTALVLAVRVLRGGGRA